MCWTEEHKLEKSKYIGKILLEYLIQLSTQKHDAAMTSIMLNSDHRMTES